MGFQFNIFIVLSFFVLKFTKFNVFSQKRASSFLRLKLGTKFQRSKAIDDLKYLKRHLTFFNVINKQSGVACVRRMKKMIKSQLEK